VSTLDRYVIRETLPPFFLALGLFTFVVAVQPMLLNAQDLLAKGVPIPTVALLLGLLLPSGLGVTIPMAFLSGLLMALGRLSGDREGVALLACGVSPLRLLRPVLLMALVATGLTLYVMVELLPDSNQRYRDICYNLLAKQTQSDIKPREFYEKLPGKILYVLDRRPEGGWNGVLLADTTTSRSRATSSSTAPGGKSRSCSTRPSGTCPATRPAATTPHTSTPSP
jgi:lipopolysaccharide export system permease protein